MRGHRALLLSMLLAGFVPSAAFGQVAPESPVHVTVNGVFVLCPKLVQTKVAPDAAELAKLGFAVTEPRKPGLLTFKGMGDQGLLLVSYEPDTHQCFLEYAGAGYAAIAGIVRDTVTGNGFVRITGGDKDGAKADVFEGPAPKRPVTVRFIIIENYTHPSATIRYSEKAAS